MKNYIFQLTITTIFALTLLSRVAASLDVRPLDTPDNIVPSLFDIPHACAVEGVVEVGDLEKLKGFIGTRKDGRTPLRCEIVYLKSDGGNFSEAVKIMDYFFSSMIATSVEDGASCYSACAIIWLGGSVPDGHNLDNPHAFRRLNPKATLGFHAPYILLSDGKYSNYDVMLNGTLSFQIAQDLLIRFQDHRIPMWFAAKLLHPDPQNFYVINTIEDANLIGAVIPQQGEAKNLESANALGNICFNLSHWGKNRSAKEGTEKAYSNNETKFKHANQYIEFLKTGTVTDVGTKYIYGLSSFLNTTYAPEEIRDFLSNNSDEAISYIDEMRDQGALLTLWQRLAERLGPKYQAIAPGFLRWKANSWSEAYSYLLPSPGVVGAHDENTRDRPEWCLITIPTDDKDDGMSESYAIGTEFDPMQELFRLPPTLLALPAATKLSELDVASATKPEASPRHLMPSWCIRASTQTERMICADPELSSIDIEFERTFSFKKAFKASLAKPVARRTMMKRNDCDTNSDCIKDAYSVGLTELRQL